jgi:hypothetical protein
VAGRIHVFDQVYGFVAFSMGQNAAYQPVDLVFLVLGGRAISGVDYDCPEVLIFVIGPPEALVLLDSIESGPAQIRS